VPTPLLFNLQAVYHLGLRPTSCWNHVESFQRRVCVSSGRKI